MSPDSCRPASRTLLQWLHDQRQQILDEWAERLSVLSSSYRQRPREELVDTVTEAFDANMEVLDSCRFSRIEKFINFITELRLGAGFPLSDVQQSFELFRSIVVRKADGSGASRTPGRVGATGQCMSRIHDSPFLRTFSAHA